MSQPNFSKSHFLKQGGLFGHGDQFYLFWGPLNKLKQRPLGPALLVCDFFLDREWNWWCFENHAIVNRKELASMFKASSQKWDWRSADSELFHKQFTQTFKWFSEGSATKVVPYVFETANVSVESHTLETLLGCLVQQEQGYAYGAWSDDEGLLGLSPELLIREQGQQMETMALAGTQALNDFEKNPNGFLEDPKEKREHHLVVNDLVAKLGGDTDVEVSEITIAKTPTLAHLKTDIRFTKSQDVELLEYVQRLHPTPALGCSPYHRADEIMGLFDQWLPRGRFGAPMGLSLDPQSAEIIVAIRNLMWDSTRVRLGSGCGVVEQSDETKEWIELTNKRHSVKKVFGLL